MGGSLVLVVDDDIDVRDALTELLVGAGYEVATAGDGLEALARIRAEPRPRLVVIDQVMDGLSGLDVCRACRVDPMLSDLPVIVLSGYGGVATAAEAGGATAVLTKPVDVKRLLEIAGRLCGSRDA